MTRQSSEVHSRVSLQCLACVASLPLLLCTKTSKERNPNAGALNVSAATFCLGSDSFQRNDTSTEWLVDLSSDFQRLLLKGTSSSKKCEFASPACCHHLCLLCYLYLESLWVFLLFSPQRRAENFGRSRYWVERSKSVQRSIPSEWEHICAGAATSELGALHLLRAGSGVHSICLWRFALGVFVLGLMLCVAMLLLAL